MIDEQAEAGGGRRPPADAGAPDAGAAPGGRRVPPPEVPEHDGREAPGHEAAGRPPAPESPPPESPAQGAAPHQGRAPQPPDQEEPAAAPPAAPPPAPEAGPPPLRAAPATAPAQTPPGRAAAPGEPFYLPQASWRWPAAVAGLALGSAPEVLLTLAAAFDGDASNTRVEVTAASAALLAVSALLVYGWQGLAAWLFSLRTAGRSLTLWGFRRPNRAFFWTIPVALAGTYAVSVAHDLVVHPEQQQIIREFPRTGTGIVLFILVAVVMAPLFEEVVFRGFLFRGLANSWGWSWAAAVSAAVFGVAHLQFDVFVPLAVLGFALAWVYRRTGSLWTCIVMHAVFNAIAVLAWALTG